MGHVRFYAAAHGTRDQPTFCSRLAFQTPGEFAGRTNGVRSRRATLYRIRVLDGVHTDYARVGHFTYHMNQNNDSVFQF